MPFSPTHTSMFTNTLRRTSFAHGEEIEQLSSNAPSTPSHNLPGMQPSASTSWINPFGRASFSVDRSDDDGYVPPETLPSSRRPSAATIISTLLHPKKERTSQDGLDSEYEPPAAMATARRPSAIFKAWKNRRGSAQTASATPTASTGRRRTSFAVSRVLAPSTLRNSRVEDGSISSDDTRRRSLSIVCRGERDSYELEPSADRIGYTGPLQTSAAGNGVTAAMAIRDTWLYGSHQWTADGRKGSVSTIATSPTISNYASVKSVLGRKSNSSSTAAVAVGLDVEDQRLQHEALQQRLKKKGNGDDDGASVVSLSLTEEIALYTTDVETVEKNAGRARGSVSGASGGGDGAAQGGAPFVWNLPEWNAGAINRRGMSVGGARLPELSPAPAVMIADPFDRLHTSADMQRIESGALDPALSPSPVRSSHSLTPTSEVASIGHHASRRTSTVQFAAPQWNTASPFGPVAAPLPAPFAATSHRPSIAASISYHSAEDHSPTSLEFPPTSLRSAPSSKIDAAARRGTTYYDASPLPIVDEMPSSPTTHSAQNIALPLPSPASPASVRSFGHSETSFEMRSARKRVSYSLPRPPPGYEHARLFEEEEEEGEEEHAPTPRLMSGEFESTCSPLSSNFEPETPGQGGATSFPGGISGVDEVVRARKVDDAGDDLHAQFCSVLLLDLGDGRAIPLGQSPGIEPRADPFALLAH